MDQATPRAVWAGSLLAALSVSAEPAETNSVTELPPVKVVASPVTHEEWILDDGSELVLLSPAQLGVLNA